jgi:uncharacterized repeat protein (TIGR03803 family)
LAAGTATPALASYTIYTITGFNGVDGIDPSSDLLLAGNSFYGVTLEGGTYGRGGVFSVPLTGGAPTVLTSFNDANGYSPASTLILSGGML